jgi:cytochrome bd ubiquinol oxidase subunit II
MPVVAAAAVGFVALVLYAVLGGADFGGGVWDLLASGPRKAQQRAAITNAIGPVWEANHVWLIFVLVLLFTCFPSAFADIMTGLYVPLSFALVGIVLRGAAFVFRNYAADVPAIQAPWTVVFGAASLLAPFFLGNAIGALATGRYAWTSPFALAVGAFAVGVCAQIAAVFILGEIASPELQNDFRRRASRATIAVWLLGFVPIVIAVRTEPQLFVTLQRPFALAAIAAAVLAGLAVIACVRTRRDGAARIAVGAEAVAVLAGWFAAQAPYLVPGQVTYTAAAALDPTIDAFLIATAAGAVVLVPSLALLFRVFKRPAAAWDQNA